MESRRDNELGHDVLCPAASALIAEHYGELCECEFITHIRSHERMIIGDV